MDSYIIILALSTIVIATYLLDFLSHKIKIPSVLFLILIGLIFRFFADKTGFELPFINQLIPIFGTIALILIVLEGGLDLELTHEKKPIISKSFFSAIALMILSAFSIGTLFYYVYKQSFYISLLNAIPLAVISSAIAIPSVKTLKSYNRDFIIYESTFSDILGIMFFNFMLVNSVITIRSIAYVGIELIVICMASIILTFLLSFLISRINHHVKFLPILAFIFLIYSAAKIYHFSPLIFILLFGLFLNNSDLIVKGKIDKYLNNESLKSALPQFKNIIIELTFLFKVFFFIIFGFSAKISDLSNLKSILIALSVTIIIFAFRYLFLKLAFKNPFKPLTLIAPRGLITILLALSIPDELKIRNFDNGVLILVVFFTVILLSFNLLTHKVKIE